MEIIRPWEIHMDMIYEIEKSSFGDPWTKDDFRQSLKNRDYLFLAAVCDGTVWGYILGSVNGDYGYIDNLAVSPEHRRQGIGEMLLNKFFEYAENSEYCCGVSLEVRESNLPAISLYRKTGFTEAGKRIKFYSSPVEDALIMMKKI